MKNYFKKLITEPTKPINIMMLPVIWFIAFNWWILTFERKWLTRKVNANHQIIAPAKIERNPQTIKKKLVALVIKFKRANKAINTNIINGLEKVNTNELIKSLKRLSWIGSFGLGCSAGLLLKIK